MIKNIGKPPYFPVESSLWLSRLSWPTRKLAIILRDLSAHDDERVVLNAKKRIMQIMGWRHDQYRRQINHLKDFGFIEQEYETTLVIRPMEQFYVKVYRSFWESPLGDEEKDVLLFIKSRRNSDGRYDINIKGTIQPSILKCCHITGLNNNERRIRANEIIDFLLRYEFLDKMRKATTHKCATTEINDYRMDSEYEVFITDNKPQEHPRRNHKNTHGETTRTPTEKPQEHPHPRILDSLESVIVREPTPNEVLNKCDETDLLMRQVEIFKSKRRLL